MQTEKLAADTLLERGVKVALPAPFVFRMFGRKTITLIVKRPTYNTLLKIASIYVSMNIDMKQLEDLNINRGFSLFDKQGDKLVRLTAVAVCNNNPVLKLVSPLIRRRLKNADFQTLYMILYMLVFFGGITDFLTIIRLISATRITEPKNLSRTKQGS